MPDSTISNLTTDHGAAQANDTVHGVRAGESGRVTLGDAAGKNVGTGADDVAAGNTTVTAANVAAVVGGDGLVARTSAMTLAARTITAGTGISIGNGDGVAGNPSVAVDGTVYRSSGTDVAVADGGTGRSSHTAYAVLCGGTTTTAAQQSIAGVGTAGQVLTSNGAGALPTFQAAGGGSGFGAHFWARVTGAGAPTLADSENVTSITDAGVGLLTVTIATDFANTTYALGTLISDSNTGDPTNDGFICLENAGARAAGSCQLFAVDSGGLLDDVTNGWSVWGFGDSA